MDQHSRSHFDYRHLDSRLLMRMPSMRYDLDSIRTHRTALATTFAPLYGPRPDPFPLQDDAETIRRQQERENFERFGIRPFNEGKRE